MHAIVGQIILLAENFAPQGFHACDGSLLPIARYQALFSVIGTKYGGNGTIDFGLPKIPNLEGAMYFIALQNT